MRELESACSDVYEGRDLSVRSIPDAKDEHPTNTYGHTLVRMKQGMKDTTNLDR